jgi:hypothetical protein
MRLIPARKRTSTLPFATTVNVFVSGNRPVCSCIEAGAGMRFNLLAAVTEDDGCCAETTAALGNKKISNSVMDL